MLIFCTDLTKMIEHLYAVLRVRGKDICSNVLLVVIKCLSFWYVERMLFEEGKKEQEKMRKRKQENTKNVKKIFLLSYTLHML